VAFVPYHRRFFGIIVAGLLVLVMIGALIPNPVDSEIPLVMQTGETSLARLKVQVRYVSRYFADTFGYARVMRFLRGVIEYEFFTSSSRRVYIGQHAHLYYTGDLAAEQSTGSVYRSASVHHFLNMADALRQELAPSGGHLVVVIPPNTLSIATHDLPAWWHIRGPLEYDLVMRDLREREIATIDLKAAFVTMPGADDLYRRTDTHWRWNAALIAFNMVMKAIRHQEWQLDPETSLSPLASAPAGDVAALLGLQEYIGDEDYALRIEQPDRAWTPVDLIRSPPFLGVFEPYAFEREPEGVRILVLGDSFTWQYWRPLLLHAGAARVGWMHHGICTFDFRDVVRFQPDYLILAPTERLMPCASNDWPQGLPHKEALVRNEVGRAEIEPK
jgi:alginate O-acetyltransferase complex protein AlgJ